VVAEPVTPVAERVQSPKRGIPVKTWDDVLDAIAAAEPAFAGFQQGADGRVRVASVSPDISLTSIQAILRNEGTAGLLDSLDLDEPLPATYSVRQLLAVKKWMHLGFASRSMAYLDLDEERNRVVVGVHEGANTADILRLLRRLPFGSQRMVIVDSGVVFQEAQATLRSTFQPVPGGVEIASSSSGAAQLCTNGFNARTLGGQLLAITADHCTTANGLMTGDRMFQPAVAPANEIAVEVAIAAR
jgi:hypothetical protein